MLYYYLLLQFMYVISKLWCLYFNVVQTLDSKSTQRQESCFVNFVSCAIQWSSNTTLEIPEPILTQEGKAPFYCITGGRSWSFPERLPLIQQLDPLLL